MRPADDRGIAMVWAAVSLPVLLLLVVLAADILRWQVLAQRLQSTVDAAALAGAQEVWVRREVDAAGTVYSQEIYLNEAEAKAQAQAVLDENLRRMGPGPKSFSVLETGVQTDPTALTVRAQAKIRAGALLAESFGLLPPDITRAATATPVIE